MPGLLPQVDPDGLLEYSVVFTDRSLNHMSATFQEVMRTISKTLQDVYGAEAVAVVPGGGTYAMEAVARQFATDRPCLIVRNGWFSFRWSQIIETGDLTSDVEVLLARPADEEAASAFGPPPIDEVVAAIKEQKPAVVFAPHVETASGIILPDDYLGAIGEAVKGVDGLFVLDCIASGAMWVDMRDVAVDVLISAPQKGWSGSPCAGLVMLSQRALARTADTRSTSFACNLARWLEIMQAYEQGGHAYHATMPTDALRTFHSVMLETVGQGLDTMKSRQQELGARVRSLLVSRGFKSVAAEGFQAPGVVVSYTDDPDIKNGSKFAGAGLQIAGGVPLRCGEPDDFRTFRLGLFGLDKLADIDRTVASLEAALDGMGAAVAEMTS